MVKAQVDPLFWSGKKVFLTGHTGFKGGWLTLWLSSMGAKVTGYALAPNTMPNFFEVCKINDVLDQSNLQFAYENHRKSLSMTIQVLGSIRILDYLLSLSDADPNRVAMTGGSGAGSHTVLMTAIDDRIKASAPVVSLSSYFYGGCPCESGMPIHACGSGTNNVEIAAMAAPRPQLVVSDGGDWTDKMPEHDFPYLQNIYEWYGAKNLVSNTHLPNDKHDFGLSKRTPVYQFMAQTLGLNLKAIQDANGQIDESGITIEKETALYVFGENGAQLPKKAIKGFDTLEALFYKSIKP